MALKPSQISRRNFVQRAGLLVSALGVGASVQAGLMDKIIKRATKKWGAEALAAPVSTAVKFHVEISFRAGFQMNSLFPSMGHSQAGANEALNFYSSPANVIAQTALKPAAGTTPNSFYTAKYTAGVGADALGTYLSTNATTKGYGAASSEAITLLDGQHTSNFLQRAPSSSVPCPAVLHAAMGPLAPVPGVQWNATGVAVTNQTGSLPALASVASNSELVGLYANLPMYFHPDEMNLLAGTFSEGSLTKGGSIDSVDNLFLTKNIPGSAAVAQVSLAGRNQAQLSLSKTIAANYTALTTGSGAFATAGALQPSSATDADSGTNLGMALASAVAAFQEGALTTMHISLDSADWHGNINALDDAAGKQGAWNAYLGANLTAFLTAMDNNTSTLTGTSPMSSSFLLSLNSEFTRTPNRNGGGTGDDNGDGGSGAFFFVGTNVNSGSYGNITPAGALQSFDPTTGKVDTTGADNVNEGNLWMAHGNLMGIPTSTLAGMLPATTSIPALTKFT